MRPTFTAFPPSVGEASDGYVSMTFTVTNGAGTNMRVTVVVPAPAKAADGYTALRRALAQAAADMEAAGH